MAVSDMEENLHPEISKVVQGQYPGSIVTHWSAAVAVVTAEGSELVVMLDRPGQPIWQSMGLEKFASEMRTAAITEAHHEDDEY